MTCKPGPGLMFSDARWVRPLLAQTNPSCRVFSTLCTCLLGFGRPEIGMSRGGGDGKSTH